MGRKYERGGGEEFKKCSKKWVEIYWKKWLKMSEEVIEKSEQKSVERADEIVVEKCFLTTLG